MIIKVLTSSGTVNLSAGTWVLTLIGGGGGGGRTNYNGGGGGGSGAVRFYTLLLPTATNDISYTIGGGGAGSTNTSGGAGGTSSITIPGVGVLSAAGGGGGGTASGGSGGGTASDSLFNAAGYPPVGSMQNATGGAGGTVGYIGLYLVRNHGNGGKGNSYLPDEGATSSTAGTQGAIYISRF